MLSYGSYSSCDACSPFSAGQTEPSYANMTGNGSPSECGMSSVLPGVSMYATPYVDPCGHRQLTNRYNSTVTYNNLAWRQAAAQIPAGVTQGNELGNRQGAFSLPNPWQSQPPQSLHSYGALVQQQAKIAALNYAGIQASPTCGAQQAMPQGPLWASECTAAPGSYGSYIPLGIPPDYSRGAPYVAAYSLSGNPGANPQAFAFLPTEGSQLVQQQGGGCNQ